MPQNQNTQMFISGKYVTVTHGKYKVEFPSAAMTHRIIKKSGSLTSHNILIASLNLLTVCLTFNFDLWRMRDTGSVTVAKMQSMSMTFMYSTWDLKRLGPFVTCWTSTVGGAGVMTHWGYQEISYYSPGCYCGITPLY